MLPGGMCVLVRNIGRAVVHGDTVCGSVSPNELRRARCGAARECRLLRVGVRRVPASFWRFCAGWDVPCPLLAPGSGSASTGRCGSNMAGAKGFYVLETVRWTALSPCHRVWHGRVISACDEGTPCRGIVLRLLSVPRTGEGGSLSCCPWKKQEGSHGFAFSARVHFCSVSDPQWYKGMSLGRAANNWSTTSIPEWTNVGGH